jgi:small subunit ribosomal protein S8e
MSKWHRDTGKKITGGRIHPYRKKKKFQRGSTPLLTELGEKENKFIKRCRGGTQKINLVKTEFINVTDEKNKTKKVKIQDVLENPASPNYVRRGILTKGTVVKTELGKVRITSRPSQTGLVNGIVIKE